MGFSEQVIYEMEPEAICGLLHVTSGGTILCTEHSTEGFRVVADGKPGPWFEQWFEGDVAETQMIESYDGQRYAYVAQRNGRQLVVVDGEPGPEFDHISAQVGPAFSRDGRHVLYGGMRGRRCLLVRDGTVHEDVFLAPVSPVFSTDGNHLAYVAQSDPAEIPKVLQLDEDTGQLAIPGRSSTSDRSGQWVVVDGAAGPLLEAINFVTMSADGAHVAYLGTMTEGLRMDHSPSKAKPQDAVWRVYLDHHPGPEFEGIAQPIFSPDGTRLAYTGQLGGRFAQVVDGEIEPEHDVVGPAIFSPDSRRVAYPVAAVRKRFLSKTATPQMVVDGKPGPEWDDIVVPQDDSEPSWGFSPDSAHFLYFGVRDKKARLVLDDQPGERQFDRVYVLGFSPETNLPAFPAAVGKEWRMVEGDREGPPFDSVGPPLFGPDGTIAYGATRKGKKTVVREETAGPLFGNINYWTTDLFTPDGKRLTYAAANEGKWMPAVGEEQGPIFDDLCAPRHLEGRAVWAAERGRSIIRVECPLD